MFFHTRQFVQSFILLVHIIYRRLASLKRNKGGWYMCSENRNRNRQVELICECREVRSNRDNNRKFDDRDRDRDRNRNVELRCQCRECNRRNSNREW